MVLRNTYCKYKSEALSDFDVLQRKSANEREPCAMKHYSAVLAALLLWEAVQGPGAVGEQCRSVPATTVCGRLYNASSAGDDRTADTNYDAYQAALFSCSPGTAQVFACLTQFPQCAQGIPVPNRRPCRDFCLKVREDCPRIFSVASTANSVLQPFVCTQYDTINCISHLSEEGQALVAKITETPTPSPESALDNCTLRIIQEGYFREGERTFARVWIALWSTLCFVSTVVTLLTFFLDRTRFHYPWRPIVYLALSFLLHSLSYFLALALGPKLIMRPTEDDTVVKTKAEWEWLHAPCIITFSLLFYTSMASALWWVILTLCWFLAASLSWGNEAIAQLAPFYHVVAWSIPLILTIILLAAKVIGGDDLTGVCFVIRDHNEESFYGLFLGLIIPLCLILICGITFMVVGFLGIVRVRHHMHKKGEQTHSLDKLSIRMGIFNVIYLVPAIIVVGCAVYELIDQPAWCPAISDSECPGCHHANVGVIATRIICSLIIGILSGAWIWSKKTALSWKKAFIRCLPRREDRTKENCLGSEQAVAVGGDVESMHVMSTQHEVSDRGSFTFPIDPRPVHVGNYSIEGHDV